MSAGSRQSLEAAGARQTDAQQAAWGVYLLHPDNQLAHRRALEPGDAELKVWANFCLKSRVVRASRSAGRLFHVREKRGASS